MTSRDTQDTSSMDFQSSPFEGPPPRQNNAALSETVESVEKDVLLINEFVPGCRRSTLRTDSTQGTQAAAGGEEDVEVTDGDHDDEDDEGDMVGIAGVDLLPNRGPPQLAATPASSASSSGSTPTPTYGSSGSSGSTTVSEAIEVGGDDSSTDSDDSFSLEPVRHRR